MKLSAIIALLLSFLFISCSSDDELDNSNLITEYNKIYMHFNVIGSPSIYNNVLVKLEYNSQGKPSKRVTDNSLVEQYDEIIYSSNQVTIVKKLNHEFYVQADNNRVFTFDESGKIIKKVFFDYDTAFSIYNETTVDYFYNQHGNIERTVSRRSDIETNWYTESIYYFNNNENLDSIVSKSYEDYSDGNGLVSWGRTVEAFSDYDTAENPLKHLTIFDEIYLRTLSKNNYAKYNKTIYDGNGNVSSFNNHEWSYFYDENEQIRFDLF